MTTSLWHLLADQPTPQWSEVMSSAVHCAVARGKMPVGRLSDMVKWMHGRIKAHQQSNRRWVANNPEVRSLCDSVRYGAIRRKRELTPEEKKARARGYMKTYRNNIKDERKRMLKMVDSGEIMVMAEKTHYKEQMKWYRRNRRRLIREGKWNGYPSKPECLTKPKKPTA